MVKKLIFIALFLTITLSFASAADVAYIYRKDFKIDQNIIDAFEEMNLEVELINENSLPADFSSYKFLFIGDERFRNADQIPVNDYPSVVANYHHGNDWGITDRDGISQLGATYPLTVLANHEIITVYTQAFIKNRIAVPYYFLDKENIAPSLEQIASTQITSSGYKFGDVISYAPPGTELANSKTQIGGLCFFGIIKTNFWTPQAKDLFIECVNSVAAECSSDLQCPESETSGPFCQDGDVYITDTQYSCQRIDFVNQCMPQENNILQQECDYSCSEGACIVPDCLTDLDCDDENSYTADICNFPATADAYCTNEPITCLINEDCGTDGFIDVPFCSEDNVAQLFETFTCNNPGTGASFCSSIQEEQTIETCDYGCSEGACVIVECFTNEECNDQNPDTEDLCLNPGTESSYCTNEPITCFFNFDCGEDGYIGDMFCSLDENVAQLFQTFTCHNPGTGASFCSSDTEEQTLEFCDFGCENATCMYEEPPAENHDVSLLDFDNAVNKIEIKNYIDGSIGDIIPESTPLICNEDYKITIKIENTGDFTEDVTFEGSINGLEVNHNPITDFLPGSVKTKWKKVNMALAEGTYTINIEALLDGFTDANPLDNTAQREIVVSCD